MSSDRKIAEYVKELGSGLYPSEPGRAPFMWKDGRNVAFKDFHVTAALGQFLMFLSTIQVPITGIKSTRIAGVPTVFFGTTVGLYKWDEDNGVEELTRASGVYTGTVNDSWQFARWGDWMVASNGVDPVQVYKNAGDFVALTAPFTWAKLIYSTDTHLLVFNLDTGENIVKWSDLDDVETWATTTTNDAGEKPMRNLDSEIITVEKLGDTIIAYTVNEMFAVNYIGRPFVFGTQFLMEGFGPAGRNAVAVVDKRHFGFGRAGVWVTDGVSVEYIHSPALFDFLYKDAETRVDKDKYDLIQAYHDRIQNTVVFYYATEGSEIQNLGVAFNYLTKAWTILSYGRTAVDDSGVFPWAIAGDHLGNIYQQSVEDAPPATASAQSVPLDTAEFYIETGIGMGGIGEGGVGGYESGSG